MESEATKTRSVFRIEDAAGSGICRTGGLCGTYHKATNAKHCLGTGFSSDDNSDNDAFLAVNFMGWKFGWASLENLKMWFPLETGRQLMKDAGGQIVEYELSDDPTIFRDSIIHDYLGHQVVFAFPNAKRRASRDIVTLEPTLEKMQ